MKRLLKSTTNVSMLITYVLTVVGFLNGQNEIAFLWLCCAASLSTYRQIRIENEEKVIGSLIVRAR